MRFVSKATGSALNPVSPGLLQHGVGAPVLEYLECIAHRQLQKDGHGGDGVVQSLQGDHVRVALQADKDGQDGQDGQEKGMADKADIMDGHQGQNGRIGQDGDITRKQHNAAHGAGRYPPFRRRCSRKYHITDRYCT